MKGTALHFFAFLIIAMALSGCSELRTRNAFEQIQLPAPRQGELPVNAFASLPVVEHLALSPSGEYVAFLQNTDGNTALITQDRSGKDVHVVVRSDNDRFHIRGYTWVNDQRLLIRVWYPDRVSDLKFTQTRLLAVNRDGSELNGDLIRINTNYTGNRRIPQFQDIFSLLPDDPRHILVWLDERIVGAPDVYRLDVYSGEKEMVAANPGWVRRWYTDLKGRVRLGVGRVGQVERAIARTDEHGEWTTLGEFDASKGEALEPLGFDGNPNILYLAGMHEGRKAVYRLRLSARNRPPELVYSDQRYDVSGHLLYSADQSRVIGVKYAAESPKLAYWDAGAQNLQTVIDKALPDRTNTIVSSAGRQHIVMSSGPVHPPVYYWLNENSAQLSKLIETYPLLKPEQLAPPETVRIKARDGLELEAYLTRPKRQSTTPGPAIVFPHGGPWARSVNDFDPWVQFLANRGWTVLRVNFRGSAGYGDAFEAAGFQRWGLEMQDDITDSAGWLTKEKLADPRKLCIVGASYGGYAALMGTVKTPDLYRCAVSFAPVTDLFRLAEDWSDFRWVDHRQNSDLVEQRIGHWWSDRARLKSTSPALQAEHVHTPLLLAHGTDDQSVNVAHSRTMAKALDRAGFKDFQYLELEDGDHHLSREVDRLRFFSAMELFLRRFQ